MRVHIVILFYKKCLGSKQSTLLLLLFSLFLSDYSMVRIQRAPIDSRTTPLGRNAMIIYLVYDGLINKNALG